MMMWIENIQKLENAAKASKEYTNGIELARKAKIERIDQINAKIQKMEKKLVAITGTPIASLREGYGFYIGRTDNINREGAIKARIDRKGASEKEKEYDSKYLVTIVKYASKIIAQERIQKNFSTQVGKLNDMKTAIESSVNKMKITFHIGEQELKNSGSRKGYDEQKNWATYQNEKLNTAIAYYTTGIHGLKQVSEASDLELLSLPKYSNYEERFKKQDEELEKITHDKDVAVARLNEIQSRGGIFAWFEKRSLAKQITQLEKQHKVLNTRNNKEKDEVKLAKIRLALFKGIKTENIHNIRLEENTSENIICPHAKDASEDFVSTKDIGEHEFISRHRGVHYVIDGKAQQAMIPANEKFVTWAKSSIERHDRDLKKNYFDDQKIHREDCGVIEVCSQLKKLNNQAHNQLFVEPVSDEDYELAIKSAEAEKPNSIENALNAPSSDAAPSLDASQALAPVLPTTNE